jgi:hypothetical protein
MYLRNLKLSDFEGENVQTLISNVCIILKRLAAFERTDPHNPSSVVNLVIPQYFGDTLIQLFQSSSVPCFNQAFAALDTAVFTGSRRIAPTPHEVLDQAEDYNYKLALKVIG